MFTYNKVLPRRKTGFFLFSKSMSENDVAFNERGVRPSRLVPSVVITNILHSGREGLDVVWHITRFFISRGRETLDRFYKELCDVSLKRAVMALSGYNVSSSARPFSLGQFVSPLQTK